MFLSLLVVSEAGEQALSRFGTRGAVLGCGNEEDLQGCAMAKGRVGRAAALAA